MEADVLEMPAIENAVRELTKVRAVVTDVLEDTVRSAVQAIRHGRYAAEDAVEEVKHTVKQRPFQAVGIAFAAGMLAGGFLTWVGLRRR